MTTGSTPATHARWWRVWGRPGTEVRYYENIEGGHGAAADNAQRARLWAMVFEFLLRHLAA